ncbi:hypothetical protein D3C76_1466500 [compost metagenome]
MFGIVNDTFTASGAAKLDQVNDTPSCNATSGRQAIRPPIKLVAIMSHGIGVPRPFTQAANRSAPKKRT